jgi:hypothetical protein
MNFLTLRGHRERRVASTSANADSAAKIAAKNLIQNNCSGGAESCEQRNHDERANRRVHIHIQQRTPRKAVVSS